MKVLQHYIITNNAVVTQWSGFCGTLSLRGSSNPSLSGFPKAAADCILSTSPDFHFTRQIRTIHHQIRRHLRDVFEKRKNSAIDALQETHRSQTTGHESSHWSWLLVIFSELTQWPTRVIHNIQRATLSKVELSACHC